MQMGQEKYGMLTFNQSLASLYGRGQITLETAMRVSYKPEELTEIIERGGVGKVAAEGFNQARMRK
jgi:twitching motility protein PilT